MAHVAAVERLSEHPVASAIVAGSDIDPEALPPVSDFQVRTGQGVSANVGDRAVLIGSPDFLREGGVFFKRKIHVGKLTDMCSTCLI